jgi:predicted MFS family arabinose efflux permease
MLAIVTLFQTVDRVVFSMVLQPIKIEFQLGDAQLGLLNGFSLGLVFAIAAIPLARLADRGSPRNVIVGSVFAWSLFTVLTAIAGSFGQLFAGRFMVGLGEAGCQPAAQAMIAARVEPERRASALASYLAGGYLGLIVALGLGGLMIQEFGWRATLVTLGLPGLALALVLRFTLGDFRPPVDTAQPRLVEALPAMRGPVVLQICLGITSTAFVSSAVLNWLPSYYLRVFGMKAGEAGFALGLTVGVGTVIGTLSGGWLSDRQQRKRVGGGLSFAAWSLLINGVLTLGVFAVPDLMTSLTLLFIAMVIGGMPMGAMYGAIHNIVPMRLRASSIAILAVSVTLFGAGLGPLATGLLSDHIATTSNSAQGLRWAMIAVTSLGVWPPLHIFWAARQQRQLAALQPKN